MNLKKKHLIILSALVLSFIFIDRASDDFFLWRIESSGRIIEIETSEVSEKLKPLRNWNIGELTIRSKAAAVVALENNNKILFSHNYRDRLPIASITKLMTALISMERYDLSDQVTVSRLASLQPGSSGNLKWGEIFSVESLLKMMLVESANDAAYVLAEKTGKREFVDLMNLKAKQIGIENSYFGNPTGLDPYFSTSTPSTINYSTVEDISILTKYIIENQPHILEILSIDEIDIYTERGDFHHTAKNTNNLLGKIENVISGKTGSTARAGGCLVLILENNENGYLVGIILGSQDRFEEAKKIIEWAKSAYRW